MPSNYFFRLPRVIRVGSKRSISGKDNTCVQGHVDGLIGEEKLFLGGTKLFHSLPSGIFADLNAYIRPGTVAAAQVSSHLVNRRKNLSVVRAFSRAISIPSVSGPSFQACGYHIECLLSEPDRVLTKPPKVLMATCRSTSAINGRSTSAFTSRPARNSSAAFHSFGVSYTRRGFENRGRVTMSLRNEKPNNTFFLYQYFVYNVAQRGRIPGFGFDGSYSSSAAYSSANSSPSVLFDGSVGQESHSNSADSEMNVPINRNLKLNSGSCYLPHPEKEETGGEDAHFICTDEQAIGVADGVGGWIEHGIDAGQYARELMSNSVSAVKEEPKGSVDPARVLEKAYSSTKAKGSSTACIIALTDQGLHAVNLGDSGFMVVRDGSTVFRSPAQQHDFNFTYQLESENSADLPSSGQVFTVPVAPGDVIIAGTDGLFDNLYNSDITAIVVHAVRAGLEPQVTAQKIAALARQRAQDKNRQTPFSAAAQEAGFRYYGGKLDDITVVVSYITNDHKEKSSPANGS